MSSTERPKKGPDEKFCSNCGEVIADAAEICPECGVRQHRAATTQGEKSPAIAAALSFIIVGLGQIYNGQVLRGIVFHVLMWFITIFAVFTFWLIFPLLIPFGFWLFNIYDAYDQAQKINLDRSE